MTAHSFIALRIRDCYSLLRKTLVAANRSYGDRWVVGPLDRWIVAAQV
jgi:hypothetical protein